MSITSLLFIVANVVAIAGACTDLPAMVAGTSAILYPREVDLAVLTRIGNGTGYDIFVHPDYPDEVIRVPRKAEFRPDDLGERNRRAEKSFQNMSAMREVLKDFVADPIALVDLRGGATGIRVRRADGYKNLMNGAAWITAKTVDQIEEIERRLKEKDLLWGDNQLENILVNKDGDIKILDSGDWVSDRRTARGDQVRLSDSRWVNAVTLAKAMAQR